MAGPSRIANHLCRGLLLLAAIASLSVLRVGAADAVAPNADRAAAREILDAVGVEGGLVVHLGCGDGSLTAALAARDSFRVHGLAATAEDLDLARRTVRDRGVYGSVSVDRLAAGRLPYVDGLVNLIVAENLHGVGMDEVMRVLCPAGVAYVKAAGQWTKTVKPRPDEIDDWTHYMHDATGNAVSDDTVVGPPRRLQWVGGPLWGRHHEHMSSVSALVSSAGRIFYVIDEGSRASIQLPPKWKLVARDAFNGCVLWKRDISLWYTHLYPLKSGPAFLPRRLVAVGQEVYVTLGLDGPLVALDAATGETIRTYPNTAAAEEAVWSDGTLFVLVNKAPATPDRYTWNNPVCWQEDNRVDKERPWDRKPRTIAAIDAASGKTLWTHDAAVAPLTLSADSARVVFHDGEKLVCLDRASGRQNWASEPAKMRLPLPTFYAPTLVLYGEVVLFAGGNRKMAGYDAETGKQLWTGKHYRAGHRSPEDLLVVGGLAWTGEFAGRGSNVWTGYNVATGQVEREFAPDIKSYWFHHRCHRSKATANFLLPSRTGIEFVDWRAESWDRNHWVRGACVYGIMPCNGLVYAPQHACACYMETKLNGLNALAPASSEPLPEVPEDARLEKGPAFGAIEPGEGKSDGGKSDGGKSDGGKSDGGVPGDWPTYRHDAARSGFVKTNVPAALTTAWQADLGGRLSGIVVADGKMLVAAIDEHTVHAFDAADGGPLWQYTAGGRVDSPPTIHGGCAVFGSADGYVYCVRMSDGQLAWRYLAAPADRRHVAYEQLESVWPVHGSVLVHDGVVHCIAGRSSFLDGGMRLCRIDAATGRLVSETALGDRIPGTDDNFQHTMQGLNMPPALPDVLSCDGEFLYMRSQKFDLAGKRTELYAGNPSWNEEVAQRAASAQTGKGTHLFSSIGFLDGSMFHRSYWLYGQMVHNGCNFWFRAGRYAPSARIMVYDDERIYGFGRLPQHLLWTPVQEYRLFAAAKRVDPEALKRVLAGGRKLNDQAGQRWIFNREMTGKMAVEELSAAHVHWSHDRPEMLARAMVLAEGTLFVAGPPDVLDEESAVSRRWDADVQRQIIEQDEALLGNRGAVLWSVSTADGKRMAELKLDSPPVWDGMAAAQGRLFIATTDGKVLCLAGK